MEIVEISLKNLLSLRGEYFTLHQGEKHITVKGIFKKSLEVLDDDGALVLIENSPNLKVCLSDFNAFSPSQGDRIYRDKTGAGFTIDRVISDDYEIGAKLYLDPYAKKENE
jgi:hypothetical protein